AISPWSNAPSKRVLTAPIITRGGRLSWRNALRALQEDRQRAIRRGAEMQDNSSLSSARPLRSRVTTDGLDRAPHRAFLRAMGLNDEAIARPFIGVVKI